MFPPPGFSPSLALEDATPTSIVASAISAAVSVGVDVPTLTSLAIATAAALTHANSPPHPWDSPPPDDDRGPHHPPPENGECQLLGPFAIFIQGALGLTALLALVYKRWRERPQRPMKIWFFDVSKQVVGSVLVHIANLVMSMLSSGQLSIRLDAASVARRIVDAEGHYKPNPCSFYLLNLAIDTTIGIPILIFLLRLLTSLFLRTPVGEPPESIQSGNYGTPPRAGWWFKQSIIYFIGLMGMKICVLIIFLVLPWISRIGDWALRWTEGDEALQVVFVMLIFPVIMNATQYYIIDSFIKNQKPEHERIPDEDAENEGFVDDEHDRGTSSGSSEEINSGDEDEELQGKHSEVAKSKAAKKYGKGSKSGRVSRQNLQTGSKDYDPMFDGESSPTVVGSMSSKSPATKEAESDDENRGPSRGSR